MYNIDPTSQRIFPESGNCHTGAPVQADSGCQLPPFIVAAAAACRLITMDDQRIELWVPVLLTALWGQSTLKPASVEKAVAEATRLLRFLRNCGARTWDDVTPQMVAAWMRKARPDRSGIHRKALPSTIRNRRWAAGMVFDIAEMLGADIDARWLLGEPLGSTLAVDSARPLTDDEAQAVRDHADAGLVASDRPVLIALAFAGGTAAQIASTTAADVDLNAAVVRFGGSSARTNPLDEWGVIEIASRLRSIRRRPGEPLHVSSRLPPHRAAHSVTVRLRNSLIDAGIKDRPGVVASSIRLHTAAAIAAADGIFAAADFLGNESLDTTARALRLNRRGVPDG